MEVRNHFSRTRVPAPKPGKSLTEQSHARSCDINTIMMRYQKTGVLEHVKKYEPQYGDVSSLDFQRSMTIVADVKSEFEALPAYVRAEFPGGATQYLNLMETPEGVSELQSILHPAEKYEPDGSPLVEEKEPPRASEEPSEPPTENQ